MRSRHLNTVGATRRAVRYRRGLRLAMICLTSSLWLSVCGCSTMSAVPVTLKEVKDYAVGSQESFSYPLDQVLKAMVLNLKQTGFSLVKIEKTSPDGFVHADWKDVSVKLYMQSVTPGLTKVRSKIRGADGLADLASEDELFEQVHDTLERGDAITWERLTGGMARVHAQADNGADIVAYYGSGARIDLSEEKGDWGKVALESGGHGYLLLSQLSPPPKPAGP